jgi:transcriptional regulator
MTDRTWGPTWNYAVIRIEADVSFNPGLTELALGELVRKMEAGRPQAWSITDMGERYARLRTAIIPFEAQIRRIDPRFKLGQDERPAVLHELLAHCPDAELRRWMQRMNARRA